MNEQIVTLTVFTFPTDERLWAFSRMALARPHLLRIPGLGFRKLMGTGRGLGFTREPDWNRYAFLGVWEHEAYARKFHLSSTLMERYRSHTTRYSTLYLQTVQSHGFWDRKQPFVPATTLPSGDNEIGILTRASIRPTRLQRFWEMVGPVSRELEEAKGLQGSIGIGELPLIRQGTFSLWTNKEGMKDFAYGSGIHRTVIERARRENWYSEELFARFTVIDKVGEFP